jgi:hypothetical protein
MIIYPLPPQELDDVTLDKQIKAIAQTLCNVHHMKDTKDIPIQLHKTVKTNDVLNWLLVCTANYKKLIDMGLACCGEYNYRFEEIKYDELTRNISHIKINEHKLRHIIEWARDNVPDLPDVVLKADTNPDIPDYLSSPYTWRFKETPFPVVMPNEYKRIKPMDPPLPAIESSYRNYYHANLKKQYVVCAGCQSCMFECDHYMSVPKWTRREKPSWLK